MSRYQKSIFNKTPNFNNKNIYLIKNINLIKTSIFEKILYLIKKTNYKTNLSR